MPLNIETDEHGLLQCRFSHTAQVGNRSTPPKVEVYLTGELAFQIMALGKRVDVNMVVHAVQGVEAPIFG